MLDYDGNICKIWKIQLLKKNRYLFLVKSGIIRSTPSEEFVSYFMARTSYISIRWWYVCPVQDHHAYFEFYSGISLKQRSERYNCWKKIDIYFSKKWDYLISSMQIRVIGSMQIRVTVQLYFTLLFELMYIVFGLTRSGFDPTIYHTGSEHANHYTTDVVDWLVGSESG
jgi:hypothetical protein